MNAALSGVLCLSLVLGAASARADGGLASSRDKKTSPANEWRKIKDSTGREYACWSPSPSLGRGLKAALTVPILGWVAKDTTSYSFPVAEIGPQRAVDPYKPDAGDGYSRSGKPIPAGTVLG